MNITAAQIIELYKYVTCTNVVAELTEDELEQEVSIGQNVIIRDDDGKNPKLYKLAFTADGFDCNEAIGLGDPVNIIALGESK